MTSTAGAILEDSDYYPFGGERVVTDTTNNNYKFTGKERDTESGLDFFIARYYSSSYGRFLIPDWASAPTAVPYADFGSPQSLNLYTYVGNNPLNSADADGHCWPMCEVLTWAVQRMAADGGARPFARNVGVGAAKGAGNFVHSNMKFGTALGQASSGNIGGAVATMMQPTPQALVPSNQTQAQVSAATQITLTIGTAVIPVRGGNTVTVTHFTDDAGRAAIAETGALNADTFVTLPEAIPPGATGPQVEGILEIGAGRGANSITFTTQRSNLVVPGNGPTTSGGAPQFQLQQPVPVNPNAFRTTPVGPPPPPPPPPPPRP